MKMAKELTAFVIVVFALCAKGESKMPMLKWAGKERVVNHHNDVPFRVLERKWGCGAGAMETPECPEIPGNPDNPELPGGRLSSAGENMVIHGDNLAALKALLPQYEGRVKCIYIDPPYNTGNEGWVYNDNVNDPQIKKWLGEVVGKEGEDFSRHDKWLCMMYPRLRLLQKLLAEDGAIFISIDDNEKFNLKLICDEIFGSPNFVADIAVVNNWKGRSDDKYIATAHESLLIYKGKDFVTNGVELPDEYDKEYKLSDERGRYRLQGLRKRGDSARREDRPNMYYPFYYNEEKDELSIESMDGAHEIFPHLSDGSDGRWRWGKDTAHERLAELVVQKVGRRNEYDVFQKDYLPNDGVKRIKPKSVWMGPEFAKETGTLEVKAILGKGKFDTPKPLGLLMYILQQATDADSIVLDSFAGSGTTAHAVLNMNKEDGGNRKFILIEMMDYADTVTAERVKRVISGYGEGDKAVEGTGGGFGYYELGEPLMIGENLNEALPLEKIREYVWYMETRGARRPEIPDTPENPGSPDNPEIPDTPDNPGDAYLLGVADGTAYYFCYERGKVVKLNRVLLRKLKTKAERYVIYADICLLDDSELEKYNITFKKIPRDIARL